LDSDKNVVETNVQVLDRAFAVLEIVSNERTSALSAAEIAEKAQLNRSTVYRLLESMAAHGYIEKNPQGRYRLGIKLVSLAGNYINSLELVTIAQPYLWDLAYQLNLSSYMAILSGAEVVYVARADSFRRNSVFTEIGWRAPAYATAHGLCLLSQFSAAALNTVLANVTFDKLAKNTVTNADDLKKMLREVRARGYAIDDESFENGMRCIGMPVYNYCGEVIAAISVSGSCEHLPNSEWCKVVDIVASAANTISNKMGYIS